MKTLLLMRHAAAGWGNARTNDHDRPLTEGGIAEAVSVAAELTSGSAIPEQILTSTAARAEQTAAAVAGALKPHPGIETRRSLYLADPDTCMEQIRSLADDLDIVLLVGHNPGLESLVARLTGETVGFATATLARIDLDCATWREIEDNCGDTTGIWRPRP